MRFAFILDPLPSLKARKDSSIAMMRALQAAGHAVWAIQQPAIHWSSLHGVCAEAVHLDMLDDDQVWFAEKMTHVVPLRDFAGVVMPPSCARTAGAATSSSAATMGCRFIVVSSAQVGQRGAEVDVHRHPADDQRRH